MRRLEINYTHEEQDEQRYEREREWWLEAAADNSRSELAENDRQKNLSITDDRQMMLPLTFAKETEASQ